MALIDPDDLIRRLILDRRRCFVITGRPREGKTRLAERMASRYGGQRLDLLSTFCGDPELAANVDTFAPDRCKRFLQPFAMGELVLVDEIEFLWHRWDEGEKLAFLNIVKVWSKPAFFGVFLPPGAAIEGFRMVDQDGRPRILSLHELQDMG